MSGRLPVTSRPDWFEIEEWDGGHLHYFSIESIRRLAHLYDLQPTHWFPVGRGIRAKQMFPHLLCGEISVVLKKRGHLLEGGSLVPTS